MLWYLDICKPVTVQGDASQKGLGAALLQDGHPVAFTSKALLPVEQHCTNIEHKQLACVFGAEWFHTYVWPCLHYWEWPQASWTDQYQESSRYTSLSTENAAMTPKLWCHHQVSTWQRDAGCRSPLSLYTPQGSRDTCRHHHQTCAHHTWEENWFPDLHPRWPSPLIPCWTDHHRLARWYQQCPTCSMLILWPQKHANIWRWPPSLKWSCHHSSIRKWEDPPSNMWRTYGNQASAKQSQTLCVLAWNQPRLQTYHWIMPNMPMSPSPPTGTVTGASANTGPGMPMATPRHWLLVLCWIWIPSCHRLLLQDVHHQKNPCISMQCLQDHLSPAGTLCRTWHLRGTPY